MLYAFSTNAYLEYPLVEAIKKIRALGYQGVEILADVPHAFPLMLSREQIAEIAKVLEETGLAISNINGNTALGFYPYHLLSPETIFEPSLCSSSAGIRQERINYTKSCIDLAVELGASCVSITSGKCLPGNPPDQAYLNLLNSLEEILEYAVQQNIRIGMEYEPGLLVENAQETLQLLKDLPCSHLGVNLDLGHAQVIGEDLTAVIKSFTSRIWNIHLEDIRGHKHYHLIPGEGGIDFLQILDTLEAIGYRKFVTMELYTYIHAPDEAARKALSYLKQIERRRDDENAYS